MPPFNLRGALFRVRAPFRFPRGPLSSHVPRPRRRVLFLYAIFYPAVPRPPRPPSAPTPQSRRSYFIFSLDFIPPPLRPPPPTHRRPASSERSARRFQRSLDRRRSLALRLNTRSRGDSAKTGVDVVCYRYNYKRDNRCRRQLDGYRCPPTASTAGSFPARHRSHGNGKQRRSCEGLTFAESQWNFGIWCRKKWRLRNVCISPEQFNSIGISRVCIE